MKNPHQRAIASELSEALKVSEGAYEQASRRYQDLGRHFEREDSVCSLYAPHIVPQGSFRLGTATRSDPLDLDLTLRLENGVSQFTHSQHKLRELVETDLAAYRKARNIVAPLEQKHRCVRLLYAGTPNFHIDVVPSIPGSHSGKELLTERMVKHGRAQQLAEAVANHAVFITDDTNSNYRIISSDWTLSNPEGYAIWFESRMELSQDLRERRLILEKIAQVDELPAYRWNSPLQECILVLKSHRDEMVWENPDFKPISIIITTLAALAYQGEADVATALSNILRSMGDYVRAERPRVPNPVNPNEDFADKWSDRRYTELRLEHNFRVWLTQAQADFENLLSESDEDRLVKKAAAFGASINRDRIRLALGDVQRPRPPAPAQIISRQPAPPWRSK